MIRPLTIVTFMMACGSGLYLYQSKHEAQVLDREIEKTIHDTATLREQSRLLAAEWTMLNDPETLRKYADTYLALKTIAPTQFTSLADLDGRLPAVRIETAPPTPSTTTDEDDSAPAVSDAAPPAAPTPPADTAPAVVAEEPKPAPAHPAPPIAAAAPVQPAAHPAVKVAVAKPATPSAAHAITGGPDQHAIEPRVADAHGFQPAVETHPAPVRAPQPQPVVAQASVSQPPAPQGQMRPTLVASAPRQAPVSAPAAPIQAQPQYTGSLLGMARGAAAPVPLPRPMPVSTAQWSNPN
jgi:hypothetical protein